MKFYNIKPLSQTPTHKLHRARQILIIAKYFALSCLALWVFYSTYAYFTNYQWHFRTPIIIRLQAPLTITHVATVLVSPLATRSGMLINKVYAAEPQDPKAILREKVIAKWGIEQWESMDYIISHESGYNTKAVNASSGACGMGQALPCSKLINKCPNFNDAACQAQWIIDYISQRYGTPLEAMIHEVQDNWY